MNKPFFVCEVEAVPVVGVFEAVAALRGSPGGEGSQCRWPIGEVRQPDFHFCDNDVAPGSVYCRGHSRLCFKPKGQVDG